MEKKFFLTVSDTFSRYSKIMEMTNTSGTHTAELIKNNWIVPFGTPKIIISDNGKQYTSQPFIQMCREKGIRHSLISPYNPTANGISERINVQIAVCLRCYEGEPLRTIITKIENNINEGYNRTIKCAPSEIVFGKNKIDLLERKSVINDKIVLRNIKKAGEFTNTKINKKRFNQTELKTGGRLFIKNYVRNKMGPYWIGPFPIVKTKANGNTILYKRGNKEEWANIKNTKPCVGIFKENESQDDVNRN